MMNLLNIRKLNVATNYISTIERGASFPRYKKLVLLLNDLQTLADAIFCDVLDNCSDYKAAELSQMLDFYDSRHREVLKSNDRPIQQAIEALLFGCEMCIYPFQRLLTQQ